ncbi:MAG: biotin-dependent carboxyltransferase family protein [Acidobacteria bacterium]|nr:biotin-dependent carboxyltransferase family protein [Acidobacteriota bacterium]MBS1865834.1 biotin-dependent carboxyltransferase family protein [Acidobacteriota bacterium]
MSVLTVLAPGLLTTVQDLGREGYGPIGVSASGAADALSLRVGNRLVGNPEGAAGIEMTLLGGQLQFSQDATIALTGADFGATLDERAVFQYSSISVKAGQIAKFGPTRSGARAYLCVRGGIVVPEFLGSRSTHLLSGLGGVEGRALRNGDVLPVGESTPLPPMTTLSQKLRAGAAPRKTIRVTRGPHWKNFSKATQENVLRQTYVVTEEANRMGIRLKGTQFELASGGEMITEGVSLGAIQVTPSGQPIILFVEQQTTGGYPKIANVIAADLSSVGQLRPRDEIRLELVTMETARALYREQENLLASWK